MTSDRPRCRPVPPEMLRHAAAGEGISEAELLDRLEQALAALPPAERSAAVVAFGMGEGSSGVAEELALSPDDAEALSRSALQLLRGALADVDPDTPPVHPRVTVRRRRASPLD